MSGDQPITAFANDDEAYYYAKENGACVYDDDRACIYCGRADH